MSDAAKAKASCKRTEDGFPVYSFKTLMGDLAGVKLDWMQFHGGPDSMLPLVTTPTPLQARVFELLGVNTA